jgi:hypothetical protein
VVRWLSLKPAEQTTNQRTLYFAYRESITMKTVAIQTQQDLDHYNHGFDHGQYLAIALMSADDLSL